MAKEDSNIVFVANYPDENTIKEGMSQRVMAIDKHFSADRRTYLSVSHRFYKKKEIHIISENAVQYRCNLFLHFFFIVRLLAKSKFVYFHSMYNVFPVFPCLLFIKSDKRLILDVHGVVPEENKFIGRNFRAMLFGFVEKYLFGRLYLAISVTDVMSAFYKEKYPACKMDQITYPILPSNVINDKYAVQDIVSEEVINVIYSGNLQAWQNIDLMVDMISSNLSPFVKYDILTGDPERMIQVLTDKGLVINENLSVNSVTPEALAEYYAKAHYGFILRDDIIVNRVACPTKVIEYMHYGMIPIVKSENIGDFYNLGYEHIAMNDFKLSAIKVQKSKKNNLIIADLKNKSENIAIRARLLDNC